MFQNVPHLHVVSLQQGVCKLFVLTPFTSESHGKVKQKIDIYRISTGKETAIVYSCMIAPHPLVICTCKRANSSGQSRSNGGCEIPTTNFHGDTANRCACHYQMCDKWTRLILSTVQCYSARKIFSSVILCNLDVPLPIQSLNFPGHSYSLGPFSC